MVQRNITFNVYEGPGQRATQKRLQHSMGKNKIVITPNLNGAELPGTYFVRENGPSSQEYIEGIKFDQSINDDVQLDIMKAFIRFLLAQYPLITFKIDASQFSSLKALYKAMKTKEFILEFESQLCYVAGDFHLFPPKPAVIAPATKGTV
jgi:hypothetical protein